MLKMSRATNSEIQVPCNPDLKYLPHQLAAIEYASKIPHTLIADKPGLGKTISAIGYINYKNIQRALIICPASLIYNWKKELKKWIVGDHKIQLVTSTKDELWGDFIIVSYTTATIIEERLSCLSFEVGILDEVHYLKTREANRTEAIIGFQGIAIQCCNVVMLSGTPIPNRPIEIFPLVEAFAHHVIDKMSYTLFGIKYCGGHKDKRGHWNFKGATNSKALGKKLRSGFMIRRSKEAVLKDLPPKRESIVYIRQSTTAKKLNKKITELSNKYLGEGMDFSEMKNMGQIATLRRKLGEEKVVDAVEYICTQLEGGHEKIVVFAYHKDVIKRLETELSKYNCVKLIGGMTSEKKNKAIELFQTNKDVRVFLGQYKAAGLGGTLHASSYVIFVEFDWSSTVNEQAIDRTHRIGQVNPVLAEYLAYEDSMDVNVLKTHLRKDKVIKEVLE